MAAPTPCVTSRLLVNVNAFTNPRTANGTPPSRCWCVPLECGGGSGSHGGRLVGRPDRHLETRKPRLEIQPLQESFFGFLGVASVTAVLPWGARQSKRSS